MHVNRNCCDTRARRSTLFVRKDILWCSSRSAPFQGRGSRQSVTSFSRGTFKLHPLPPPSGTSQQSVGKLQLWNQSFLRLSEEGSKGRGYLFWDRRVIVHSYTCHRENKSNICTVRWKLRVRRAGRWGLEFSHLSCAGSWYQHPGYQRENIGAPLPRSWGFVRSGHAGAAVPRPPSSAESRCRWSVMKLQFVISRTSVWQL